jgi:ribosomal protein L11 methyltransferase
MMIQLLEKFIKGGERVLDVGTGSGVLAIASVKLGAMTCVAIDNDDWSIENARENIDKNGVNDKIQLIKGDLAAVPNSEFDIVVANLNRNTLLYIGNEISALCAKGGVLLVTGVLTLDEEDITKCYGEKGFVSAEAIREAEWSALVFRRSP